MATGIDGVARRRHEAIPGIPLPLSSLRHLARSARDRAPVAAVAPSLIQAGRPSAGWARLCAGIGFAVAVAPVSAENWTFTPSVAATETYSSNVNYAILGPKESDFITSATAALQISGQGANLKLNGSIAATGLFYARQTQNNSFAPVVSLFGTLEAVDRFLFVEAQAYVSQNFISAFGPQPGNLVNATANRYTQQTYSVAPYIQGRFGNSNITYLVRDDNIWTLSSQFGDASVQAPGTYLNRVQARASTPAAPTGWTAEYIGTSYQPTTTDTLGSYSIQVGRGILTYQYDPQVQVSARGGYESDRFPLSSSEGPVYGVGGSWAPTDRMLLTGFWEHRFFGSSYSVEFSNRMPRSSFSAIFARGLNTYPQNALTIPAGANVAAFVDSAFTTRIPDPAERALAVQQFLAQSGLPSTLATPVNIFAAQIQLQESGTVTFVLLGQRNSLAFSAFYLKSEAISGTGSVLPPALQFGQNNTQTGGGVSFNHQLSGLTNLTASATYSSTKGNTTSGPFAESRTTNAYANLGTTTRIGAKTTASAGVGYTRFTSSGIVESSSSSVNVYAGLSHTF